MRHILTKISFCMLLLGVFAAGSCSKNELTDGDRFSLFYPDITDIGPSYAMNITPTYHGAKPEDFQIFRVTLDGKACQTEAFAIDPQTGMFQILSTETLPVGLYAISISCTSGGKEYRFPDMIKVNMMKPVPEGISVDPSELTLTLEQVNNVDSEEALPAAQVVTDGDHVSIRSYRIANVRRDGNIVEDWEKFFAIDAESGKITVLRNQTFSAGLYVLDLRLTTAVVGADSEDGLFAEALKVDIVSPPISLEYEPKVKRVEEGSGYVSAPPVYMASAKGLEFSLKAVYPSDVPVSVDASTGVITLAQENTLKAGDAVQISVRLSNAYGTKDFDQVLKIDMIDFLEPITKISYNDSTVWHSTAVSMKPVEVDGDDVKFSFASLPAELSELLIDENTGAITTIKGNAMPKGEYTLTVKVANDKNEMTDDIAFNIVDNPYFFTKVSWGNNLGLPVAENASQHRVSVDESVTVTVDKTASDLTEEGWKNVRFEIIDGSKINNKDTEVKYASIDAETGAIMTNPSKFTSIPQKRAHVVIVKVTSGAGTSGETVRKVPVFFDFNVLRSASGKPEYKIEYTPFVIMCDPKAGGIFPAPSIKDADGNELADKSHIRMTYRRNAYYWNIDGAASHVDGGPGTDGTFLNGLWKNFYTTAGLKTLPTSLDNVIPVYTYATHKTLDYPSNRIGYIDEADLKLHIAPEKWRNDDGYADGVFVAEVDLGYEGKDPGSGADPYKMYPFFIWFDTEF